MTRTIAVRLARLGALLAGLVGAVAVAAAPAPVAAYGTEHLYEVTLSYNCQNMTICPSTPFGIGGIWGWLEPDAAGQADGELLFQGHQNANPALNGTGKSIAVNGYTTINCPTPASGPLCFLVALEQPPTDPNNNYFVFFTTFQTAGGDMQLPILTPATPGQYNQHFAPGIDVTATVTKV
jgi:hypothetical protein